MVFHDNHEIAVWTALEALDTGYLEFLALDYTRVGVVKLDGEGLLEVPVVKLCFTAFSMGTRDVLKIKLMSRIFGDLEASLTAVCAPTAVSVIRRIHSRQKLWPLAHWTMKA